MAARAFMAAWQSRQWPAMHASLQVRRRERVTLQRLRDLFGVKAITKWRIAAAQHVSVATGLVTEDGPAGAMTPEMVAVAVDAWYRMGRDLYHRTILLNVVLESEGADDYGQPPRDVTTGRWGVNETSALRETPVAG
jgi:hypothetical protein